MQAGSIDIGRRVRDKGILNFFPELNYRSWKTTIGLLKPRMKMGANRTGIRHET